jgi:hypothetical protein
MHLDLDEILFALIFTLFTVFLISVVDGLLLKLGLVGWMASALAFAGYIIATRDNIKIREIQTTCICCGKRLTTEEYEIDTGNLCEECRKETINAE